LATSWGRWSSCETSIHNPQPPKSQGVRPQRVLQNSHQLAFLQEISGDGPSRGLSPPAVLPSGPSCPPAPGPAMQERALHETPRLEAQPCQAPEALLSCAVECVRSNPAKRGSWLSGGVVRRRGCFGQVCNTLKKHQPVVAVQSCSCKKVPCVCSERFGKARPS